MTLERRLQVVAPEGGDAAPDVTIKVAFASADLRRIDQHFGSAERFAIYRVGAGRSQLVTVVEFGRLARDGNEDKLLEKFVVLEGCVAVYCQAVGGSAVRQLITMGVQPIKLPPGRTINAELDALQAQLRDGPAGWLRHALTRHNPKDPSRFDAMANEGWDE